MAKGGKVYHWKHGWIPLDRAAYDNKMGKGPKPTGKAKGGSLTNGQRREIINMMRRQRGEKPLPPKGRVPERKKSGEVTFTVVDREAEIDARVEKSTAEMRRERYRSLTTVDGVDFVTYKSSAMDPLGDDHGRPYALTRDQMQPLADAYNEVKAQFPGMQPIQIVGVDGKSGAFGITTWDGRRISISSETFDEARIAYAHGEWGNHGAIAGQFTDDPEGFARAVMTHELGHALQMQNQTALRRGQELALERVSAKELGYDTTDWSEGAADEKMPRWEIDTLNAQSVYATGNKFEWFAEAFADGWFNGDKATPQGKRALAILSEAYGKLGRIPIPAPGNFVQKGVVA